jgi:UDP-GlcNAc:undecaprenyl-phosphate GlcNAc-1-phosphate transferase
LGTVSWGATAAAGIAAGAVVGLGLGRALIRRPPPWAERTNIRGLRVPAVLGLPLVAAGGVFALLPPVLVARPRIAGAVAGLCLLLGLAGGLDDRRGDRGARGFRGHLSAAASGRVTTGMVKLAAGAAGGLAAGVALSHSWTVLGTALLVALTANLMNLLDTAPGRAGKVALLVWVPLLLWGSRPWAAASAGMLGALPVCLMLDLRERGMLGDAGANPLGGIVGLGLALALPPPAAWVVVVVLLGLNLCSELWSFSEIIERLRPLRAFDHLGRVDLGPGDASSE